LKLCEVVIAHASAIVATANAVECFTGVHTRACVVRSQRLLVPGQRPLIYLLRLGQLALVPIQDPQVVDGLEGRGVVRAQRLLPPGQRPMIHLLRLGQLALVTIQVPEIVDGPEGRGVVRAQRLLAPGQRPLIHLLRLGQLALVPIQVPQAGRDKNVPAWPSDPP
jgi:hypothetical protein